MRAMTRGATVALLLAALPASFSSPTVDAELTHRVWLLDGVPAESTLAALRSSGVDGLVLPVGRVEVRADSCLLTLNSLGDLKPLAGWDVSPLVWVSGDDDARGDAANFGEEFAPVQRMLGGKAPLVLAARTFWAGLPAFATALAQRAGGGLQVALPIQQLQANLPTGKLGGLRWVAVALGNPQALGFPTSTLADDLAALNTLDAARLDYRVAIVVAPLVSPPPVPAGLSFATLASPLVASFTPGEQGYVFTLRRPLDWGDRRLPANQRVEVESVDTARYDRDLGLILRAVRPTLTGWDTAGLPAPAPAFGMSREAFLAYLNGGLPFPVPEVTATWTSPTRLQVALSNPTPDASALATAANWVELRFVGGELLDVDTGSFSGAEYGRYENGVWRRSVARDAGAVRLFVAYLAPSARVSGGAVSFISRPSEVTATTTLLLGDGRSMSGPVQRVEATKP
jgi:hypothetical protein